MTNSLKTFGLMTLILAAMTMTGCGTDSPLSPAAPAAPQESIDTAPPAIPTGLSAAAVENLVKLSWDANVLDTDFHGFMVYRVVWGISFPMLNLPQKENLWIDDHPVNVACTYVVTALDESGNESAWSAINFLGIEDEPELRLDF